MEDIRSMAPAALRHRILLNFAVQSEGIDTDGLIDQVLETVRQTTERQAEQALA